MAIISLSDKQTVDTGKIKRVALHADELVVIYNGQIPGITVKGPGIVDDADLLDKARDQEKLHYLVFRDPKSK